MPLQTIVLNVHQISFTSVVHCFVYVLLSSTGIISLIFYFSGLSNLGNSQKPQKCNLEISDNKSHQHPSNSDYKIIFAQQVGKKFRFELEYKDGSTKWVPDSQVDQNLIDNFFSNKANKTR